MAATGCPRVGEPRDGSVSGLWAAIITAAARMGSAVAPVPIGSDAARFGLTRALSRLDDSRDLVIELAEGRVPPLVIAVLERRLTAPDHEALERLWVGLDRM